MGPPYVAPTVEQFKTDRPEFEKTPINVIAAALRDAADQVDPCQAKGRFYQTVSYLAADLLALSPYGQNARLIIPKTGVTTYRTQYLRLVALNGGGRAFAP